MYRITAPDQMNRTFAEAFNARNIDALLDLYEPDALLIVDGDTSCRGLEQIAAQLRDLLRLPGTMTSLNNFCVRHGDLALLRADYVLIDAGAEVLKGSSSELVRLQVDGSWRYVIDHACGASLPARHHQYVGAAPWPAPSIADEME